MEAFRFCTFCLLLLLISLCICRGDLCGQWCECFKSQEGIQQVCDSYGGTRLKDIFPDVTELVIDGGIFTRINKEDLKNGTGLNTLSITNTDLQRIEYGSFDSLVNLEYLFISYNNLYHISDMLFLHCQKLGKLAITNNFLHILTNETFTGLELTVYSIDLTNNRIFNIENGSLDGLEKLQILRLSGNLILSISSDVFGHLPNLAWLQLDSNKIASIQNYSFFRLENLVRLDLQDNNLEKLIENSLGGLPKLSHLDLSRNHFDHLPRFSMLPSLRQINLDYNKLRVIGRGEFKKLNNLEFCSIRFNNELSVIEARAFIGLNKLTVLKITNNVQLGSIQRNIFGSVHSLTHLELDWNRMTTFDEKLFAGAEHLVKAGINGNPLDCSCSALWIRLAMEHKDIHTWINDWQNITCSSPSVMYAKKIADIPAEKFGCPNMFTTNNSKHIKTNILDIPLWCILTITGIMTVSIIYN